MTVPFDHDPETCRRSRVHVRELRVDEGHEDGPVDDEEDDQGEEESYYGFSEEELAGKDDLSARLPCNEDLLQATSELEGTELWDPGEPVLSSPSILYCSAQQRKVPGYTEIEPALVSENPSVFSAKVSSLLARLSGPCPTKADSPALIASYGGKSFRAIVDSGAELNCLNLQFAREMGIEFGETESEATAIGENKIQLAGVTKSDVIIYSDFNGRTIPIDLQRAAVINALGADVIIGEPAKQSSGLETNSRRKNITIRYDGQILAKPYLSVSSRVYEVARVCRSIILPPGDGCRVPVPQGLAGERILLFASRRDTPAGLSSGYKTVRDGHFEITNISNEPIQLWKSKPVGEVRACLAVKPTQGLPAGFIQKTFSAGQGQVQISAQKQGKQDGQAQVSDQVTNSAEKKSNSTEKKPNSSAKKTKKPGSAPPISAGGEEPAKSSKKEKQEQIEAGSAKVFHSSQEAGGLPSWAKMFSDTVQRRDPGKTEVPHSVKGYGEVDCGARAKLCGAGRVKGKPSGVASVRGPAAAELPELITEEDSEEEEEAFQGYEGQEGQEQRETGPAGGAVEEPFSDGSRYNDYAKPGIKKTVAEPEIILDPDGIMPEDAKAAFRRVTNEYAELFTRAPGKYNGSYGRVNTSIELASQPTPNSKVYLPSYSDKQLEIMGDLMDTLMDYGVLQRPEDLGITPTVVSPSLLIPKAEPGEYRLVTDFSGLNKHIRKYPSVSPTINEARNALAKKRYFVHLDLANFFFQSGLDNKDSKFLSTFHPFRGLVTYVVTPQGLKNSSEQGYEMLARVYGDMIRDRRLVRQADSVFPQGDTFEECLANYEETLYRARRANLTFKPGKVVICPLKIVLFGWKLENSRWSPTAHTTSSLSIAERPTNVFGLRSFLGSFKVFCECVPRYAELLHELEKLVGGRSSTEKIVWTDELIKVFEKAKKATNDVTAITVPRPTDKLRTYSDFSMDARAVGGRLEIVREEDGEEKVYHGGFFSVVLDKYKAAWVPCEAEAAGVRLTLMHYEPYIRENNHPTQHFTDNMPVVQAWRRCQQGKFSASSRISTFLVNLSSLSVELIYKPGKMMVSADYSSRHPVPCEEKTGCQVCKFAGEWQSMGDSSSNIGSITVSDVLEGRVIMPFIQRNTWLGQQLVDKVHIKLRELIRTGQHPDKKKTKGDFTVLKKLYGLYQAGDLDIQADGLVMVKMRDGNFNGKVISVPYKLMPGIAFAIHTRMSHPSKGQLLSLMSRYFYCPGGATIIHSVVESCVQCRSLQKVPKEFIMDSTEKVESLGSRFAVDVIERGGQKILVTREKLSQYTWLELIPDQTTATFRRIILRTLLPWVNPTGAIVRCDGAAALSSLAREADQSESIFHQYKIKFDIGRPTNPNKNAIAENAVRESEKEILKHRPGVKTLSEEDLAVVMKIMNDRIRNRGRTAKEILIRREVLTNKPLNVSDSQLSSEQFEKRLETNKKAQTRREGPAEKQQELHVGDVVYIKAQMSKHQPREQYIITRFEQDMVLVQKLQSKFGSKEYVMYRHELMPVNTSKDDLYSSIRKEELREQQQQVEQLEEKLPDQNVPKDTGTASSIQKTQSQKRKRGRPRKNINSPAQDRKPSEKKEETRSIPVRQSERVRRPRISRVESSASPQTSRYYKSGRARFVCETEMIETQLHPHDPAKYWWFPPVGNYEFMEDPDWTFPAWEEWGNEREDWFQDGGGQAAQQALQDEARALLEDRGPDEYLSGSSLEYESSEDITVDETSGEQQELAAEFRYLSRNPETVRQISTDRVVNLDNLPPVPDGPEQESPRAAQLRRPKSVRKVRRPSKFDDFV